MRQLMFTFLCSSLMWGLSAGAGEVSSTTNSAPVETAVKDKTLASKQMTKEQEAFEAQTDAFLAEMIQKLDNQTFFEQLSFKGTDAIQVWAKFPRHGLKLGNYYIAQLKKYVEQNRALSEEVAIEVTGQANDIVQLNESLVVLPSRKLSQDYRAWFVQNKVDAYKVLGDAEVPRQVAQFKYIGGDTAQTPLGAYLKNTLNPKKITLVYDPQASIVGNLSGAFGGSFADHQLVISVGPQILKDMLQAKAVRDLEHNEVLQHELGHYQIQFDLHQGKISVLAGMINILAGDAQQYRDAVRTLTGDEGFDLANIRIEEGYTYGITAGLILQQALDQFAAIRQLDEAVVSRTQLDDLMHTLGRLNYYLKQSYQHLRATYLATLYVLEGLKNDLFPLIYYRDQITRDINFKFPMLVEAAKKGETEKEFYVLFVLPENLVQHAVQEETPGKAGEAYHEIELDARDVARVKAYLAQQGLYAGKAGGINELAQDVIKELLIQGFFPYVEGGKSLPRGKTFAQNWQGFFDQLKKMVDNPLAKYPPYFQDEAEKDKD